MADKAAPERIPLPDDASAIFDYYEEQGWTDGLPIIPPTEERVQKMLGGTKAAPDKSLGQIPPSNSDVVVAKVATNAVMAGCRPEYMPVVLCALEALLDPLCNLYGYQATTYPKAPLIIVNGPVRQRIKLNSGYGVFGPGWRANATIGRAVRLCMLNIGGGTPGVTDKDTHAHPGKYTMCIGENEENSPWEPLHVERGFKKEDSCVTVLLSEGPHNINDHDNTTGKGVLGVCADTMCTLGMNIVFRHNSDPVLMLGPEHAANCAQDGFSKRDVKKFIWNKARLPHYKLKTGGMYSFHTWPVWYMSLDEHDLLPLCPDENQIIVIVAGGPGKQSACVPPLTRSVTKRVAE